MTRELKDRQLRLIKIITEIESEQLLASVEKILLNKANFQKTNPELFSDATSEISLEKLMHEQNVKALSLKEMKQIQKDLDIQEPIEELIKMAK